MPKLEITNMVMVQDAATGRVVVQERVKRWRGIAFPGGHAEPGESIYDSAVREVKEETGLDIRNLQACGFMYWFNNQTEDKYFTYFYKTTDYEGELLDVTDEGKVFWTSLTQLDDRKIHRGLLFLERRSRAGQDKGQSVGDRLPLIKEWG